MVSMVGITILHILYWNDAILLEGSTITGLRMAGSVLESLCVPVVATYVMISGYYDTSEEFRPSRLLRLLAEVWFYSIGLHLVLRAAGAVPPGESIWDLARYVLPVMMGHYWFVTAFVVMEILAPLLTAAAERVDRRTLRGVIGGLLAYECVLSSQIRSSEMRFLGKGRGASLFRKLCGLCRCADRCFFSSCEDGELLVSDECSVSLQLSVRSDGILRTVPDVPGNPDSGGKSRPADPEPLSSYLRRVPHSVSCGSSSRMAAGTGREGRDFCADNAGPGVLCVGDRLCAVRVSCLQRRGCPSEASV